MTRADIIRNLTGKRRALGLSQEKLAALAGLKGGASHISKIESGKVEPKIGTWLRLAEALAEEKAKADAVGT